MASGDMKEVSLPSNSVLEFCDSSVSTADGLAEQVQLMPLRQMGKTL